MTPAAIHEIGMIVYDLCWLAIIVFGIWRFTK